MKTCAKCRQMKPLEQFHRQPSGKQGRYCYCKPCANAVQKASREKNGRPPAKRQWNLKTRYGLTSVVVDMMLAEQGGACGLCARVLGGRYHIDHDHITKRARGLLCHRCNIVIGGLDDPTFRSAAVAWLERGR